MTQRELASNLHKAAYSLRKLAGEVTEKDLTKSAELDPVKVRDFMLFYGGSRNVQETDSNNLG